MEKQQKQHLAIFNPPFLDLILEGRKTIEGRFSKVRCAPFGVIEEGDVVLMKESGGLVRGSFVVAKLESFGNLSQEKLKELEASYSESLCADVDPQYWQRRHASKYATLMHVAQPTRFERPFPFPKKDRRGWVVLDKPINATA
ncbi:ASCH domain-containing protein [Candidatus Azambacteria bacterium]|nr:ASCH domain-containing protein [Candidatus Azambacteria bacterium]